MRRALIGTNAGSKSGLIEALEALQTQQTTLMQQKGQMAEAEANIVVSARDIDRANRTFLADDAQKLAEAERQAGDLTERLKKAEARLDHTILTSPIAGTVHASTLTTVGQVVTAGQDLMRVVSDKDALEVEAYLPNRDIGFVKPGDHAVLKIESFPFTRYGTVDAGGDPRGPRRHPRARCRPDREGRHPHPAGDVPVRWPAHPEPRLRRHLASRQAPPSTSTARRFPSAREWPSPPRSEPDLGASSNTSSHPSSKSHRRAMKER